LYKNQKQYRLPGFDYSTNTSYFITINTKNREHYFGEIIDNRIVLSEIGTYVHLNFLNIMQKVKWLSLDNYTIMPNHLHMIITLKNDSNKEKVIALGIRPLVSNSVSSFCNHLKGNITNWAKANNKPFSWQARFHDRIIRNNEYNQIYNYINYNALNWKTDLEYLKVC
jgi:putative transposase